MPGSSRPPKKQNKFRRKCWPFRKFVTMAAAVFRPTLSLPNFACQPVFPAIESGCPAMKSLLRLSHLTGVILLLAAIGFLSWITTTRAQRAANVSSLTQTLPLPIDANSPTGYPGGIRELIVPEHNNDSYQWLAQTQLMLARHEWRLRHVDYDNAPYGREIQTPSPYRWWLGFVTWVEHQRTGQSLALAVEQAALFSDPALQIVLLIVTVVFTAWCFGAAPASLLCLGFATLFPFSSSFLPGQVDDYGLSLIGALWSILPLLAGANALSETKSDVTGVARRWFIFAGIAGGIGLWLSVTREAPVLLGIILGGLIASGTTRRGSGIKPLLPWRAWALAGGGATCVAFLLEYFPGHLALKEWRVETIHPLYALAWLGTGELLGTLQLSLREGKTAWTGRRLITAIFALIAIGAVPVVFLRKAGGVWLSSDALASHLTALPNGPASDNLFGWLWSGHFNTTLVATFLPLGLLVPAIWLLLRRTTSLPHRLAIGLALGPVMVAIGLAGFKLRWWNFVDSSLLTLAVAAVLPLAERTRWIFLGVAALVLTPGIASLVPARGNSTADTVTETEIISLVERDLAHWLANRVGPDGATVLAPPSLTTSLYFHGGLRGIGTPYADNTEGTAAALHLAASTSADEAQVLTRKRKVTHIIIPSWDPTLDEYASLGSGQPEHTLVGLLHHWLPPRWLRAVPYHLPQIPGFENQSVAVFEVTDIQDNVTALSRLGEYFAEMDMPAQAAAVRHALEQSFPNEIGSLVAQAQVSMALRDGPAFTRILNALIPRLGEDEVQGLAWDRRVSLAIVLAEGKQKDAAREQMERCLAELDEPLMRSLSPLALYRLQVLAKAFGLEIAEPSLRQLAPTLLPSEMRSAL
jgi:hypothetical protein